MIETFLEQPELFPTTYFFLQQIKTRSAEEQTTIMEALFAAAEYYGQMRRKMGTLFLNHPIQVAVLLAQLDADQATIIAALFHDVLEDTNISAAAIQKRFGLEVYQLVEAVTHQRMFSTREFSEKVYQKSRKDPRVAWIKIADRCSNLTDYHLCFSQEKLAEFLEETNTFYIQQLAEIPGVPKDLIKLLKRLTEKSSHHLQISQ